MARTYYTKPGACVRALRAGIITLAMGAERWRCYDAVDEPHVPDPETAMTRTVARLLADSLEAHGVDQIFCVPGESYVGLTSVLVARNTVRIVVCRHEAGAAFMAAADGRLRDRAGVAVVSRGPGLANGLVAVHSAYHDATALVMLIGQVERAEFGRQALQEQNYSLLLADITKLVIEVNEPDTASEALARAFHVAESGTPGPVAVVLPEDLFDAVTAAPVDPPRPRSSPDPGRATSIGWSECWRKPRDRWCWWEARCSLTRYATPGPLRTCAALRNAGRCRSARPIAVRSCSTHATRTSGGTWASASRLS